MGLATGPTVLVTPPAACQGYPEKPDSPFSDVFSSLGSGNDEKSRNVSSTRQKVSRQFFNFFPYDVARLEASGGFAGA
jgi:hypothetical protein